MIRRKLKKKAAQLPAVKKGDLKPSRLRSLSLPLARGLSRDRDGCRGDLYIGLDPSLNGFGMAAIDTSGTMHYHPTIKTKAKSGMGRVEEILHKVRNEILKYQGLARMGTYKKIIVTREDYDRKANDVADTPLKELGGALRWVLHELGLELHYLNIMSVKKFATGKGNVDKSDIPDIIYRRYGFDGDSDEADAFAVALTSWSLANSKKVKGLDKPQKDVLANLADHPLATA